MQHALPRDGEPTLEFDGQQLGRTDTRGQGKKSWTELTLYRTAGGSLVVQTVARTDHPGWREYFSASVYADAAAMVRGVKHTVPMMGLLEDAAVQHEDIAQALDVAESATERIE